MTFRSNVDPWLGAVLWCCVFVTAACGVFIIAIGAPLNLLALSLPLLVALSALCLWVRYATFYRLDEQRLQAFSGPFRRTIALEALTAVTACRSWRPGLALSLTGLRLEFNGRSLLISPEDRAAFLAELYRLKPELQAQA